MKALLIDETIKIEKIIAHNLIQDEHRTIYSYFKEYKRILNLALNKYSTQNWIQK